MVKHTSGPWEMEESEDLCWVENGALQVCELVAGKSCATEKHLPREEKIANAHLIAAAPELLEALENCSRELGKHIVAHNLIGDNIIDNPADFQTVGEAEDVIKKAKGE